MRRLPFILMLVACLALALAGTASATMWTLLTQDQGTEGSDELTNLSIVDASKLFFTASYIDYSQSLLGSVVWVFYSGDGGNTLEKRYYLDITMGNLIASGTLVNDIVMLNANQGVIGGLWFFDGLGGSGPFVAGTLDGGVTFEKRESFATGLLNSYGINAVGFKSETKAFAFGTPKLSYTSDDAGATWTKLPNLPTQYSNYNELREVAFDGKDGIYVCASYVYVEEDPYTGGDDDDDDFVDDDDDDNEGKGSAKGDDLVLGEYGELFRSFDNGLTWASIFTYEDITDQAYDTAGFPRVDFFDENHGWLTVVGLSSSETPMTDILYTDDGAATWNRASLPSDPGGLGEPGEYVIFDVAAVNLEFLYAVGYNAYTAQSVILFSEDAGQTWSFDDYQGVGELRGIEMMDNRRGWAFGGHMTVVSFFNDQNQAPIADAGPDRNVNPGATVELDGSNSYDPDGDGLTYMWTLIDGPTVELSDTTSPNPTFTALSEDAQYTFQLVVTDDFAFAASQPDEVVVTAGSPATDDDDDDSSDDDDDASPSDDDDETGDDDDDDDDNDDEGGCCG